MPSLSGMIQTLHDISHKKKMKPYLVHITHKFHNSLKFSLKFFLIHLHIYVPFKSYLAVIATSHTNSHCWNFNYK